MATNFRQSNTKVLVGDGAPTSGDALVNNIGSFPVETVYMNSETGVIYVRNGVTKTTNDWVSVSPGGSSYLVKAEVTLTDAQIKALPTTPIEIIAAPGAGKVIIITTSLLKVNTVSGYTNSGSAVARLVYNNDEGDASGRLPSFSNSLINDTLTLIGSAAAVNTPEEYEPATNVINKKIMLYCDNLGNGDFTDGNEANTLKVTVYYVVVDL